MDAAPRLSDAFVDERVRTLIATRVPLFPGDRILVLASPALAATFTARYPRHPVVHATLGTEERGAATHVLCASAEALPLRSERFQFVASHLGVADLPPGRRAAAFAEVRRVLYLFGKVGFSVRGDPEPVRRALAAAGLGKVTAEKAGLDQEGPVHVVWGKRVD